MNPNALNYIEQARQQLPQLSHATNILTKKKGKLTPAQKDALDKLIDKYAEYLNVALSLNDDNKARVVKLVESLNSYYNFLHTYELDNVFTAQGKFRPTILEEFLFLLFRNYVSDKIQEFDAEGILGSGAAKAYTNIYFKARDFRDFIESPEIGINEKDQNFAIYRIFDISINNATPLKIRIPAIAIEAKTYIDKTMLDSIIATAEKIKSGNPHTRFIAVAEKYDVSYGVDPAYSRIDQIYVLRKSMRKQWCNIDAEVVWRLFDETIQHLERPWFDIEKKIAEDGVVI
ncbi:MAG: Bpu10I family restriction endonuclease [Muribaculaceae bacterium]|nr:Bpu10I family restriction endonuclease [Muribaculaceae bacterium]